MKKKKDIKLKTHTSAKQSHYDKEAKYYDAFDAYNEEHRSKSINQLIEKLLKKYNVKTVLDVTCGTGSQVLWLAKQGFDVVGSDINAKMLTIARRKAKKEKLKIKFIKADMRTVQVGKFDAVISIFNAVGHLTKKDFEKAMQNARSNLKEGGLFIFDINNLSYLLKGTNITSLTIDRLTSIGKTKIRRIQYSTINKEGILTSYTTFYEQHGSEKPNVTKSKQTLQIYTAKQLKEMLAKNGFEVLQQYGIDGSKFIENKSESIFTIAKKMVITSF